MTLVKRKTRPLAVIIAVLVTAGIAAPPVAEAAWWPWSKRQERAAERRAQEDAQAVAEMSMPERLARAEAHIRDLTGQVEALTFQVRQLQLQIGVDGAVVGAVPETAAPVAQIPTEPPGRSVIDAPERQPIDLTAPADGALIGTATTDVAAVTEVASLGEPRADYDRAYNSILTGDYERAEAWFRGFLTTYPQDTRAADAQYWLGESLFARGQYGPAADEFLAGYKSYPQSAKAPDTLLKLGLSLAGLGEREAACQTYAEVLRKYPESSNALRDRVAAEQAVASC
ncbi:tol-pal system protein YbgF [Bauldia sp.]|uniref:tol-pal system protein YbgF n=1 Tax=Bauldia sp. TaxID=2575872 RepID=UPI003BAD91B7